jgi:subtilase family serine protease
MRPVLRPVFGIALAAILAGCSHGMSGIAPTADSGTNSVTRQSVHSLYSGSLRPDGSAEVCAQTRSGFARCLSLIQLGVQPNAGGYGPTDLIAAYNLPAAIKQQTVAVVDAFDDPNAEADLGVYRSHFGLAACTTSNGCFRKVNQNGHPSPLPSPNVGWAEEMSLDVDMVSAICPTCHILLVEGNSNSFSDLALSVDEAAKLRANAISNSYGGGESGGSSEDSHYNHPGHMVTASTGDSGYGPQFPATSRYVTAVGGTRLVRDGSTRGWSETVWSGAGSGCSSFESKPSWQTDPSCSNRTEADTSAVADPATGVVVYDSYGISPGFYIFGGTSVSSPIIASVYALAGNAKRLTYASKIYSHHNKLYDVTSGANGSCGGSYLCTGKVGYDGPTGWGTPNGVGAF